MSDNNKNLTISIKSSIDDGFKKLAAQLELVAKLSTSMLVQLNRAADAQSTLASASTRASTNIKKNADAATKAIKDTTKASESKVTAIKKEVTAEEKKAAALKKTHAELRAQETTYRKLAALHKAGGNLSGYMAAREKQYSASAQRTKLETGNTSTKFIKTTVAAALRGELDKVLNGKSFKVAALSSIADSPLITPLKKEAIAIATERANKAALSAQLAASTKVATEVAKTAKSVTEAEEAKRAVAAKELAEAKARSQALMLGIANRALRDSVPNSQALGDLLSTLIAKRTATNKVLAAQNVAGVGLGTSRFRDTMRRYDNYGDITAQRLASTAAITQGRGSLSSHINRSLGIKSDWEIEAKTRQNAMLARKFGKIIDPDAEPAIKRVYGNLKRVSALKIKPPIDQKHVDFLNRFNKSIMKTGELLFRLQYAFITMAGPAIGFGLLADKFIELQSNIGRASKTTEDFTEGFKDVNRIARETYMNINAVSKVYSRFAQDANKYNLSQKDITGLTETVTVLTAASGGNKAGAEAGLNQFQQAFASDKFGGDELRSVFENSPLLAKAIAAGIQKTTMDKASMGELRVMASDKKRGVSGKQLIDALNSDMVKKEVLKLKESIMPTFAGAVTNMGNTLINVAGRIESKYKLAKKINYAADVVDSSIFMSKLDFKERRQSIQQGVVEGRIKPEDAKQLLAKNDRLQKDSENLQKITNAVLMMVAIMVLDSAVSKTAKFAGSNFGKTAQVLGVNAEIAAGKRAGYYAMAGQQVPKSPGLMGVGKAAATDIGIMATNAFPGISRLGKSAGSALGTLADGIKAASRPLATFIDDILLFTKRFIMGTPVLANMIRAVGTFFSRLIFGIPVIGWVIGLVVTLASAFTKAALGADLANRKFDILRGTIYMVGDAISLTVVAIKGKLAELSQWASNFVKTTFLGYKDTGKTDADGNKILDNKTSWANRIGNTWNKFVQGTGAGKRIHDFGQAAVDAADRHDSNKAKLKQQQMAIPLNANLTGPGFDGGMGYPSSADSASKKGKKPGKDKVDRFAEAINSANDIIREITDATDELGQENGYNGFYAEIDKTRNGAIRRMTKLFRKLGKEIPAKLLGELNKALDSQEIAKLGDKVRELSTESIWSSRSTMLAGKGMSSTSVSLDSQIMGVLKSNLTNFPMALNPSKGIDVAQDFDTAANSTSTQKALTRMFEIMAESVESEPNLQKRTKLLDLYNIALKNVTVVMMESINAIKAKLREMNLDSAFSVQSTAFQNNLLAKGIFGKEAEAATAMYEIDRDQQKFIADNFIQNADDVLSLVGKPMQAWIDKATESIIKLPPSLREGKATATTDKTKSTKDLSNVEVVGNKLIHATPSEQLAAIENANKVYADRRRNEEEKLRLLSEQTKNYWLGAARAVSSYLEAARDAASLTADIMGKALTSLEDKLTEFLNTGKIKGGLKEFLYNIQTELNRMFIKSYIMPKIIGAIGDILPKIPVIGKVFTKWRDSQKAKLEDKRGDIKDVMKITATNVYINGNPVSGGTTSTAGLPSDAGAPKEPPVIGDEKIPPLGDTAGGLGGTFKGLFAKIGGFIKGIISKIWPVIKSIFGSLFGSMFGGGLEAAGSISAGILHTGGLAASASISKRVPAAMFGNLSSGEVPIIAKDDETVLTSSQMKGIRNRLASSGTVNNSVTSFSPTINVNYTGAGESSKGDAEHIGKILQESVRTEMANWVAKERRQGGMLR